MKDLYVFSHMFEHMFRNHGTHAEAQPVIDAHRRAVKHHPEPDQGFTLGVFLCVHVAIIFRLQGSIARIKAVHHGLLCQGGFGCWIGIGPAQIELMQRVADDQTAMLDIAIGKLLIELLYPVQKRLFRRWQRLNVAVFVTRHAISLRLSLNILKTQ
jgi:hypothetical protein